MLTDVFSITQTLTIHLRFKRAAINFLYHFKVAKIVHFGVFFCLRYHDNASLLWYHSTYYYISMFYCMQHRTYWWLCVPKTLYTIWFLRKIDLHFCVWKKRVIGYWVINSFFSIHRACKHQHLKKKTNFPYARLNYNYFRISFSRLAPLNWFRSVPFRKVPIA